MNIKIINRYKIKNTPNTIFCGRGSPLGNPFPINTFQGRDDVCELYIDWFNLNLRHPENIQGFHKQLHTIEAMARKHPIIHLECYCAPKRCHCETIKKYIEDKIKED